MIRTVGPRPRIWLKQEDFENLGQDDFVRVRVRPTGNDPDYPEPFDIKIPVSWWNSKTYVTSRSWRDGGGYNFPRPTEELLRFVEPTPADRLDR